MQKHWSLGFALALTTAVMWGLLPIALKGLLNVMDVMTITWYRFCVSAVLAYAWYGHRNKQSLFSLFSRHSIGLTAIATFSLLSNYAFYLLGLNFTTAGAAQIVIQLAPLLLLLGSIVIFKEAFSIKQWLGVIAFCIGLLMFFHHRFDSLLNTNLLNTNDQYQKGILWVVAAAVCWAIYGLAQKQIIKKENSSSLLLIIYIAGTVVFLPMATPSQVLALIPLEWGLLAFASLNTIVAYNAFGLAMTYWETSRVSAVIALAPLLTLVFVQILVQWQPDYMEAEPMDVISWMGAALLITGASVAALAKSRQRA